MNFNYKLSNIIAMDETPVWCLKPVVAGAKTVSMKTTVVAFLKIIDFEYKQDCSKQHLTTLFYRVASQNKNSNSRVFQVIFLNFPGFIPWKFKDFPGQFRRNQGFSRIFSPIIISGDSL